MKKLLLAAALCAGFYAHAKTLFSEPKIMRFVADHSMRSMSGDTSACDDFTSDMEVSLTTNGATRRWEVEGGKDEMCGYMRQAAAAFTVLQARTQTEFDDVKITRAGFPWMSATVSYVQRTSISAAAMPAMTVESRDELVLKRTFSGLKISKVASSASGGL